jgi:hypothetical protein
MGLDTDMTAWKGEDYLSLREWRKHWELHSHFAVLWEERASEQELKDNDYEGFNGPSVKLTVDDLKELISLTKDGSFDVDYMGWCEEDKAEFMEYYIAAFNQAIDLINEGWEVRAGSSY